VPEFTEAGVILAITYSIRDGRRGEFFDLMKELKPLLAGIGGTDCTVYEDRSRPNYFMEVFRFRMRPSLRPSTTSSTRTARSRRSTRSWMTSSKPRRATSRSSSAGCRELG